MSPSDCSHINIETIHFGVVAIELLPTEFPWCMAHTAIAEDPVRFREGLIQESLHTIFEFHRRPGRFDECLLVLEMRFKIVECLDV